MKGSYSLALFSMAVLSACQASDTRADANSERDAIEISNTFLAGNHLLMNDVEIEAVDMGNRWRLSYRPRRIGTGGLVVVVVNKNGEVVHAEASQ
jgi:hypothetical protein